MTVCVVVPVCVVLPVCVRDASLRCVASCVSGAGLRRGGSCDVGHRSDSCDEVTVCIRRCQFASGLPAKFASQTISATPVQPLRDRFYLL